MDMGMDGMGMDMGSEGMFAGENMGIAQAYWFTIAAAVGVLVLRRIADFISTRTSIRQVRRKPNAVPSRPRTVWQQIPATVRTIFREASYPQILQFRGRFSRHFSFLPTGRWLLLAGYWLMLLVMLWENAILSPDDPLSAYYWEKIAFRAAWVSVTQVPFIFCLSCKLNVVALLTGISYERLQWFHRWAGRTLFFTVIVHWSFFFQEWSLAEFVQTELQMMPMVYFGFGAWSVIGWIFLTSISFFRDLCYELFVLQHLAAAGVFLWVLYSHVPGYAQYNIWVAVAFVAFDQIGRTCYSLWQNTHLTKSSNGKRGIAIGYNATLEALPDGFTRVCVADVRFRWSAGQHVYLCAPTVGIFEAHPFTIANDAGSGPAPRELQLLLKAHGGFTKRLWRRANKQAAAPQKPLRVFLSGPWGMPPDLRSHETLVFISSATGATFTSPMLQQLARQEHCARSVHFWWIVRTADQLRWFRAQVEEAALALQRRGVAVGLHFVVTCPDGAQCGDHPEPQLTTTAASITEKDAVTVTVYKGRASDEKGDSISSSTPSLASPPPQPAVASCCGGNAATDKPPATPTSPAVIQSGCCCSGGASNDAGAKESATEKGASACCCSAQPDSASELDSDSSASQKDKKRGSIAKLADVQGCSPNCLCPLLQHADPDADATAAAMADGGSCVCLHAPRARPALDGIIRPPVEEANGETAVIACGPAGLVADVRNAVASLSDERATHKGSGAQGIFLWAERYDW